LAREDGAAAAAVVAVAKKDVSQLITDLQD